MQSKYVGDKSDFYKYGLLRRISGLTDPDTSTSDLTLAVVWYLVPDECCNGDGRNVGYLRDSPANRRDYRECDPLLWSTLRDLVCGNRRCVHEIPRTGILPDGTKFYDAPLHFPGYLARDSERKRELRGLWLAGALQAARRADVVYLDPDTGITQDETQMYRKKGPKYTYLPDIRVFWGRGQSLVIYHHLGRSDVAQQIEDKKNQLREFTEPIALRCGSRIFFILPQGNHRPHLRACINRMLAEEGCWGRHFEEV